MNIYVSGVNYKTTPLEIREKLSFNNDEAKAALKELSKLSCITECALLSTCNRTEVYIYSESGNFDNGAVEELLCELKGLDIYDIKKYFYAYSHSKALKHIFKVTSGLDSQVLGEDQVLGQFKNAYDISLEAGTSSGVLNTLFRQAITAAKKLKTYNNQSRDVVSIASLAIKLLSGIFGGQLKEKSVLIIGAGKIGLLALNDLAAGEIKKVYITARRRNKTDDISNSYDNVQIIDYDDRYEVMDECDIFISSTSSPHYTITRDMLEKSLVSKSKERVFVDLAVPRDIDAEIGQLANVKYFNIDDLKEDSLGNAENELTEVSKVDEIIGEFIREFEKWYRFRDVLPLIKDIQKFTDQLLKEKINNALTKLKNLSEEDKETVKLSITGAVSGILNKFIYSVREYGDKDDIETYYRCLRDVMREN